MQYDHLDDRRNDNTFSTIQESRHAYKSVRRQRLQQTRVPESSQPQHGSASSDLHTDAADSDGDSPDVDDDQASADADAATVNTTDAEPVPWTATIFYFVKTLRLCMLSECLQQLIA